MHGVPNEFRREHPLIGRVYHRTNRMFKVAGVPQDVVTNYVRAVDEFLYGF